MTMFQPTRQAGFCWRSYKSGPSLFANPFDSVTGMVGQLPLRTLPGTQPRTPRLCEQLLAVYWRGLYPIIRFLFLQPVSERPKLLLNIELLSLDDGRERA